MIDFGPQPAQLPPGITETVVLKGEIPFVNLAWSPLGEVIATLGTDGKTEFWSTSTGEPTAGIGALEWAAPRLRPFTADSQTGRPATKTAPSSPVWRKKVRGSGENWARKPKPPLPQYQKPGYASWDPRRILVTGGAGFLGFGFGSTNTEVRLRIDEFASALEKFGELQPTRVGVEIATSKPPLLADALSKFSGPAELRVARLAEIATEWQTFTGADPLHGIRPLRRLWDVDLITAPFFSAEPAYIAPESFKPEDPRDPGDRYDLTAQADRKHSKRASPTPGKSAEAAPRSNSAVLLGPAFSSVAATASDGSIVIQTLGWVPFTRCDKPDWYPAREEPLKLPNSAGATEMTWAPDGRMFVSALPDQTIAVWEMPGGRQTRLLEGHTSAISSLVFSNDGRLLLSAQAGEVRIWDVLNWDLAAVVKYPTSAEIELIPHPLGPAVAIIEGSATAALWSIDTDALLAAAWRGRSVHYVSAKIALVGDSGVGKTGLGYRIAYGHFEPSSSTHGQQFWPLQQLRHTRADGTECEAVLWDLAGQSDYRLIHALFLEDVDLALVLFDGGNSHEPLKGVEYWLKHLSRPAVSKCRTILVAARSDRGSPPLTRREIDEFCRHFRVDGGYVATSASSGEGIPELLDRIRQLIGWEEMAATVTTEVFKTIKDVLLRSFKAGKRETPLASPAEIRRRVSEISPDLRFTGAELQTAIGHLAKHGYVTVLKSLSGNQAVLLKPELLNNLAASIVLEARRDPKGLGALDEGRLLSGGYHLPELESLSRTDAATLLDSAAAGFLRNHVCFRESTGTQSFLVFPSLINQKRPYLETAETEDDYVYIATGAVENAYAALVVLLGYTNTFTRTDQWYNQAQYEVGPVEICGFRQREEREGEVEFTLYYSPRTPSYARNLFQGLFEKFLRAREVEVTVYPPVRCSRCRTRQDHKVVRECLKAGRDLVFCYFCGERIPLQAPAAPAPAWSQSERIDRGELETRLRTAFESALVTIKRLVANRTPVSCFISYAWGNPEHEEWVRRLEKHLREAGIVTIFDANDNREFGLSINRFIDRIATSDFVAVVGTPLYRQKYENVVSADGSVVAAEADRIAPRLRGSEREKATVLPLLLAGSENESFPPFLRDRVYADFRNWRTHYSTLFDLILNIYRIRTNDPSVSELRETMLI